MPTSPNSFKKQPNEQYNIEVDFSKELNKVSAVISSKEVIATLNGTDVTDAVIEGSNISSTEMSVIIGVKGGLTGNTYKITVRVTSNEDLDSSLSEKCVYEADILMIVFEI
jgi:hypothetical protein